VLGAPTGGNMGNGSLNVQAIYINGVQVKTPPTIVYQGGTAPSSPNTGDLWWNSPNLMMWTGSAWVTVSNAVSVTSFNTRTGAVTLTLTDVTNVGGAPIASPVFTGTPTAPTPAPTDSSTKIATTAFVKAQPTGLVPEADTPPASPSAGQLWYDSVQCQLYVYYGTQWVAATNQLGAYVPISGGTMTGSLTNNVSIGAGAPVTSGALTGTIQAKGPLLSGPFSGGYEGAVGYNRYWDGTSWRATATGPSAMIFQGSGGSINFQGSNVSTTQGAAVSSDTNAFYITPSSTAPSATSAGDLFAGSRVVVGSTALPSSGLQAGAIVGMQTVTAGNSILAGNTYYDGAWKTINTGYSFTLAHNSSTGIGQLEVGSNVAAGATPTFSNALIFTPQGNIATGGTAIPASTSATNSFFTTGYVVGYSQTINTYPASGGTGWNYLLANYGGVFLPYSNGIGLLVGNASGAANGSVASWGGVYTFGSNGVFNVANGVVQAPQIQAIDGPGNIVQIYRSSNSTVYQYQPNCYNSVDNSSGTFNWSWGGNSNMTLTSAGTLTTRGAAFIGGTIQVGGNGVMYTNYSTGANVALFWNGTGLYGYVNNTQVGQFQFVSDIKRKRNVEKSVEDALATLKTIELFSFDRYATEEDAKNENIDGFIGHEAVGFLAQQIEEVLPELITRIPTKVEEGRAKDSYVDHEMTLNIDATQIIARCVSAIQQLSKRVETLEAQLAKAT
jgi:hypothetical protein